MAAVGWMEFNVPFQHKYGYINDELMAAINVIKSKSFDHDRPILYCSFYRGCIC